MRRIIPSVTTHSQGKLWKSKIAEIETLGLKEVGLFVTGLSPKARKECFSELKFLQHRHHFTIPFVHAVSNMEEREFCFLVDEFGTEFFNLHPAREYPLEHALGRGIRKKILIENSSYSTALTKEDLWGFAGLCFDVSHLEDSRISFPKVFEANLALTKEFPVLANHISAVGTIPQHYEHGKACFSVHDVEVGFIDYLSHIPTEAFASLCATELENSLSTQGSTITTIEKILSESSLKIAA